MDKEILRRRAEELKKEIFDKLESDYKELSKISNSEELKKKMKRYEEVYEKEFDKLASFINEKGLVGIVPLDYTEKFVNKKLRLFIKLKKKNNLLPKEDHQTYQNLNKEFIEQEQQDKEKDTYTCAECFQDKTEHYGEICNKCVKSCLEFHKDNDYPDIVYCLKYLFDVCEKEACLTKMNKEIENKKSGNQKITTLESNPTKTPQQQEDLTKKKAKLKELEEKEKELSKSLPLDIQITNLEREIRELENKSTRTSEEETLLATKKKELVRLLAEQKKNSSTGENNGKSDKTDLYVGVGVVIVVLVGLVLILVVKIKVESNKEINLTETVIEKVKNKNYSTSYLEKKVALVAREEIEGDDDFSIIEYSNSEKVGLKPQKCEFATHLKKNGFTPEHYSNFQSKNAQEWLDYFYPKEKRVNIRELDISEVGLEGSLKLEKFTNLEALNCFRNKIMELEFSDCIQLKKIDCSDNQLSDLDLGNLSNLEFLDCDNNKLVNLRLTNCTEITYLNCRDNSLASLDFLSECANLEALNCLNNLLVNLDLAQCPNLKEFSCRNNQLTSLSISNLDNLKELSCDGNKLTNLDCNNCQKLEIIECYDNKLTSFNLTNCSNITKIYCDDNFLTSLTFLENLSSEKLKTLSLSNNDFFSSDLTPLERFVSLRELRLNSGRFFGLLEPLKNLTRLEVLSISDTNIEGGLEYLPNSLQDLYCSARKRPESRIKIIEQELRKFGDPNYEDNFEDKLVKELIEENAKIESLEDEIIRLDNLTKQQRKKIVEAYLKFAPEKELLKTLIISCLEYNEAKKKRLPVVELRNQFEKFQLELESEIIRRKKLLEDAYQKVLSITVNINEKIEAGGNIYIANIIKGHADLDYNGYQQEPKLEEMLEKNNPSNEEIQKREIKTTTGINNELTTISKIEKSLAIKSEEARIKITGNLTGNSNVIGNTFTGDANLSHNRTLNQQIKNVQGFNVEGSHVNLTNAFNLHYQLINIYNNMPPKNKKYKKVVTKKVIIVQGFNIQSDGNILTGASVENNTAESGTTEEEIIVQGFNITENSKNNNLENTS
ncbi:6488_t:CDS:2, partial [Gigaspora margarita]